MRPITGNQDIIWDGASFIALHLQSKFPYSDKVQREDRA